MSDPAILFVKPNAISAEDKKALQTAGVIVVEIENVNDAKITRAHAELDTTEMLAAAAKAMQGSEVATKAFGAALSAALVAKFGSPKK